jgi:hypothetical protein
VQRIHVNLTVASAWPDGQWRRRIELRRRARRLGLQAQAARLAFGLGPRGGSGGLNRAGRTSWRAGHA